MNLNFVLTKAIITEKSLIEASLGRFSFLVVKTATKGQIREAVEHTFGVNVVAIRTTAISPKTYRTGKKRQPKIGPAAKKAIVELKKGQKIDLFDIKSEGK